MKSLQPFLAAIILTMLSGCSPITAAIHDQPYGFLRGAYDGFWCVPKVAIEAALMVFSYIGVPYGDLGPIIRTPNTGAPYLLGFTLCLIGVLLGLAREAINRVHRARSSESKGNKTQMKP